jgi:hypothetical protein
VTKPRCQSHLEPFRAGSADCVQLWAISNRSLSYHPSTESSSASSIGRSQLYVKNNPHATSITNKVSNTVAQLKGVPLFRSPHHTSVPSSLPPPFPSRPWISIPIDRRSRVIADGKESSPDSEETNRRKSTYVFHFATSHNDY